MSSKILDLVAQLENTLEESPRPRISSGTKRIVDLEIVSDIISDMKVTIPEDIRWAQGVLAEKDEILANARAEAEDIVREAKEQREKLIDESGIMAETEARAMELMQKARENANIVTSGARQYTDDILYDLQRYLKEYIGIIEKNRSELHDAYTDGEDEQTPEYIEPEETQDTPDNVPDEHFDGAGLASAQAVD